MNQYSESVPAMRDQQTTLEGIRHEGSRHRRRQQGSGFVKQLAAAGHQVAVTARDTAKAQALAQQHGAKAVLAAGAADDPDAIVVATPYSKAAGGLRGVGDLHVGYGTDLGTGIAPTWIRKN
ncbi:NAD(P)-binding domain-containing protein [Caldimonas tepidiphila]|uniref:NAD(P)-binding domain-containing protein n=1 Tax=Caldimonas tepidiphila TaxID=2315841 RepID=UPI001F0BA55D|nr:NAD(P)-binding domain-containing protein [Caldimonas tepidiphila]